MSFKTVANLLIKYVTRRSPDLVIGGATPYVRRWYLLPKNEVINLFVHEFLRDDTRVPHDHPGASLSVLLRGGYTEHDASGAHVREEGSVVLRRAAYAHRITLPNGPVWTLFLMGPRLRKWGFHCPSGWKSAPDYYADRERRGLLDDHEDPTTALARDP